jgi:hypothetical protein
MVFRSRLGVFALLTMLVAVACGGSTTPSTATSSSVADLPSTAPSIATAPSAIPSPTATPTLAPTATPVPTPSPTPEPWKTFTSKVNKYTIKYPPDWVATAGDKNTLDGFDSFSEARFYVGHGLETFTVDVGDFIRQDIAYYKSHFKTKVVSNKAIKLANGYTGRIVEFLGTENSTKVGISHVLVAKGRSWYEINFWLDDPSISSGRELFPDIYKSWRPTP